MDQDEDLIARVYPILHVSKYASRAIEASKRCVPPRIHLKSQVQHDRQDRGSTGSPEERNAPAHYYLPCVELRFSDIPRTKHGLIFGCDPESDIVLPDLKGISYHHFTLTFDDAQCLIVKDWGSRWGIEITYDDQGHGKRRDFKWIVGGHRLPRRVRTILVTVDAAIQFQIVAARHETSSQAYIDKVGRFLQGAAIAEELFGDLDLPPRADTELPTGAHTPGTGPIYLKEEIGRGAFAVVTYFWNVSSGDEFALKEPKKEFDVDAWKKEARIMSQISHSHIVKLFGACLTPRPQLHLEFVPGGSLEDQESITSDEVVSILCQCLSALKYLHERDPPIAHRDIKPNNIFIQHRDSGSIHVKLGDFGLSKDSEYLNTICGSHAYLAPEICVRAISSGTGTTSYTVAVDIWSLGVVICELMCGLPRYKTSYMDGGTAWGEKVIARLEKDFEERPGQVVKYLLKAMVVMKPGSRLPASDCLDQAWLLPGEAEDSRSPGRNTPVNEDEMTTIRHCSADRGATNDEHTVLWARGSSMQRQSTFSTEANRFARSDAPSQESTASVSRSTRKRLATTSESSVKRRECCPISLETHLGEAGKNTGTWPRHSDISAPSNLPRNQSCPQRSANNVDSYDIDEEEVLGAAILLQATRQDPLGGQCKGLVDSSPTQAGAERPTLDSEVSHLSTRDILFDRPGLSYMVIRRQAVSMRTSDFQFNISQIFAAARTKKSQKDYCLRVLKQRGVVKRAARYDDAWVPFRDGVFVCQEVGFEDELMPLLLHSQLRIPEREENYLLRHKRAPNLGEIPVGDFAELKYGHDVVAYRPSERTINITQLLKAGGVPLSTLPKFFAEHPEVTKKIVHDHERTKGTYISYEDALIPCAQFNLDSSSVRRLLGSSLAPDDTSRNVHDNKEDPAITPPCINSGTSGGHTCLGNGLSAEAVPSKLDRLSN